MKYLADTQHLCFQLSHVGSLRKAICFSCDSAKELEAQPLAGWLGGWMAGWEGGGRTQHFLTVSSQLFQT